MYDFDTCKYNIYYKLTLTSKNATEAAEDAERTELITAGLSEVIVKVEESENLMTHISDQMSLLAVQTALIDLDDGREKIDDSEPQDNFDKTSLFPLKENSFF